MNWFELAYAVDGKSCESMSQSLPAESATTDCRLRLVLRNRPFIAEKTQLPPSPTSTWRSSKCAQVRRLDAEHRFPAVAPQNTKGIESGRTLNTTQHNALLWYCEILRGCKYSRSFMIWRSPTMELNTRLPRAVQLSKPFAVP